MNELAYTLEQAEQDLRGAYWVIRNSRLTNWKAVNKIRSIKDAMRRMGVRKFEIDDACYCLKRFDCNRCDKNNHGIPCYEIGKRRKKAAEEKARETKYIEEIVS